MIVFKIVDKYEGQIRTLFQSLNGSRVLPMGIWLAAKVRMVQDGPSGTWYESGFHVFLDKEDAREYRNKGFMTRLDRLHIVACRARGLRPKMHSRSPVYLASHLKVLPSFEG